VSTDNKEGKSEPIGQDLGKGAAEIAQKKGLQPDAKARFRRKAIPVAFMGMDEEGARPILLAERLLHGVELLQWVGDEGKQLVSPLPAAVESKQGRQPLPEWAANHDPGGRIVAGKHTGKIFRHQCAAIDGKGVNQRGRGNAGQGLAGKTEDKPGQAVHGTENQAEK
jgi:hypothetical protein